MKTTQNLKTAPISGRSTRFGMTLVEIMAAILVLSIGLVGVLSAIPFGGLRMAQMQEADNSSALGRNAARVMKSNGWANPANWRYENGFTNENSVKANGNLNLTFPFFVDPISKSVDPPEFFATTPVGGFDSFFTRVAPVQNRVVPGAGRPAINAAQIERAFYLQDDIIYGYASDEDETFYRPRVETTDGLLGDVGDPNATQPFSGRYTWLATVSPKNSSGDFTDCSKDALSAADYDVVVFENRVPGDEKAFAALLEGSGYQGGAVTLDLTGGVDATNGALDALDVERLIEQLETTRYILLTGREDIPTNGNFRAFARWYKIANYGVVATDATGVPATLRLTLVGPNTPKCWTPTFDAAGNKVADGLPVTATIFPGAIGVYSGTANF
ncbi:MAG: prepilin-type N-terminal cleavage/methylation domain-containing protein [Thermoguttaceae bacterium]|nr:prepilin-type N-terminal cleavage/methylation domain-containing protein [Thermoguttaceae bacterium]